MLTKRNKFKSSTKVYWEQKNPKGNMVFGKGNSFEVGWKPAIIDLLKFFNKGVDTK